MNNNILKSSCIKFISKNKLKLVSYRELNVKNLSTCDFEICLLSNKVVIHTLMLDYHLKIISIKTEINGGNITESTFVDVTALIKFCNDTRRGIGYTNNS